MSKDDFIPIDKEGKSVTWYNCGPTVYDDAHLGHARNYVTIDVLRRVLRDYFKFDVKFVMNITDVDDKIILRGRQQHLLAEFTSRHEGLDDEVLRTVRAAYEAYVKKNLPLLPSELNPEKYETEATKAYGHVLKGKSLANDSSPPGDKEAKIKMHLKTASSAAAALSEAQKQQSTDAIELYTKSEDVLLPYLDSQLGSSVDANDYGIWTKLTKKFEARFFDDMRALNVLDPDVLTRVTEYGPQMVDFVKTVVDNKYAYATSHGSVYFDINAFEKDGNSYARLEPWNRNNRDLQADGEGALTEKTTEKRSDADFALWKSSKPGEPSWPSPWGPGRPGWHLECSVMASDVVGEVIDIHSGGVDLRFPHHDNELAQSEAYWLSKGCEGHDHSHSHQWVNYFWHMGHLSIAGSKMSKSLKNFTTIKEALGKEEWNARSLRIVFLLGTWRNGIEITEELVKSAASWEDKVNNFFLKAKDLERNPSASIPGLEQQKASVTADSSLLEALSNAQSRLDTALCDSFDTSTAMATISDLITQYNTTDRFSLTDETVLSLARWVTQIVTIFGLDGSASPDDASRIGWSGIDIPPEAKEFVYPLSQLRDEVRRAAIAGDLSSSNLAALPEQKSRPSKIQDAAAIPYAETLNSFQNAVQALSAAEAPAKDFLSLCDQLRDVSLWDLGIYLEDQAPPLPALVRPIDKQLRAERAVKEEIAKAKAEAKLKREKEEEERRKAKEAQAKISNLDMFRTQEYSAWDDEGLPIRDAKGDEIPKSRGKKLRKEWEKQRKLHEEWKKTQDATAGEGKEV